MNLSLKEKFWRKPNKKMACTLSSIGTSHFFIWYVSFMKKVDRKENSVCEKIATI